ncbi:hypothetical protein GOP47_0005641 [Adiantum capillus-veneris]|uniref:Protein ENHANCED DISEASE RESISTANCE 2 C-terminal domain-containing protein n=1 Tax=Adiantum capillus-veneris TaxID=13818 RepID=A0A9D4V661_ADICA|nr:hypothetical protein GOP47_0005641 [Adiantum capillus-veneris]
MAEAPESQCPPEQREWVDELRRSGPAAHHPLSSAAPPPLNSWLCPPGNVFSIRSADYLHSKVKTPGGHWLLHPLAFDFLQSQSQISHIMKHPHSRVRSALDAALRSGASAPHQPFVWVFNLQLGNRTHHSMVLYFVSFSPPPPGSLMQRFLDGNDSFRNSRLKGLVNFPEAPWLVQTLVGQRPVCMIGKYLKCKYIREKNYMEVDIDVASLSLNRTALSLTFGLLHLVVTDIAFVLEATRPEELPECILGATRLMKLDPSTATHIDMSL